MAVGAGIVLVPVSVGVVGFAVFMVSILIAYPGIYLFQKLYIQTLFESKHPKDYKEVVAELLGKKWSVFLGILYLLMMLIWTVIYAEIVAKSLASYLYMFNLTTNPHLEQNALYSAFLMVALIFIGMKSQKIFVRISTFLVALLIIAIVIVSICLIPLWSVNNLLVLPSDGGEFVAKSIIMLPFSLTSILFIQSLSPMVIGYRKEYANQDKDMVLKKTLRVMTLAFIILVVVIGFYVLSFSLVIPKSQALEATANNQSAFILLESHGLSNQVLYSCGIIISLCAILTSFLSILAGMEESLRGVLRAKLKSTSLIIENKGLLNLNTIVVIAIFLLTWLSIVFDAPIYKLVPLSGPIFGILGCLVPAYIVFKRPALKKYRTKSIYFIIFIGVILVISPLLTSALS
ncbi:MULTISPECIES: aromatic amino acid transport family protein [unclassified Francisella]|uniref:aromatic amino acid transport family protein n=1 Tax=unclassified Francisella TaxID=2610885 RepID=UPI002E33BE4D|nr:MULTISPECIES: aromatic amino acid transport family protein [unclassified Francisella]MED7819208.1 aromatic amino acid transport family protein [Francisella sp. 19S2-4]MED7829972.1 aromatic amino acid transport family protein [Francisella sp. 19S2-10]